MDQRPNFFTDRIGTGQIAKRREPMLGCIGVQTRVSDHIVKTSLIFSWQHIGDGLAI